MRASGFLASSEFEARLASTASPRLEFTRGPSAAAVLFSFFSAQREISRDL